MRAVTARRRRRDPLPAPLAFTRLGLRWAEMMVASQSVIAHRMSRANTPAQVLEMGTEKIEAALLASQAMSRHFLRSPPTTVPAALDAWARLFVCGMAPFHAKAMSNSRRVRPAIRRSRG
jgi:hypothetical protein